MTEWPISRLGDHAQAKGGKRLPKGMRVQEEPTDHHYLRVVDMSDNGTVDLSSVRYLQPDAHQAISRYVITDDDVYISIAGTIGRVGVVPRALSGANLTENAAKITNFDEHLTHRFLGFYLQSPQGQAAIRSQTVGTSQPKLALFRIEELLVPLPPVAVQERIADVLGSIDDLIENNRRRIEVLEEMAQAIYREWFVHFRFPDHEDATFVDSPLAPIPEGWRVGSIQDLCERIQAGGTPKRSEQAFWDGGSVDWYKTGELDDSILTNSVERITQQALTSSSARVFSSDTILMAIYGATIGQLGLLRKQSSANQAALGLVADPESSSTEYLWFTLLELRESFRSNAQGAAQQNTSKKLVSEAVALLPQRSLVQEFTDVVGPAWRLSHELTLHVTTLEKVRDLLLPKLVTGEIDVSELDLDALVGAAG